MTGEPDSSGFLWFLLVKKNEKNYNYNVDICA